MEQKHASVIIWLTLFTHDSAEKTQTCLLKFWHSKMLHMVENIPHECVACLWSQLRHIFEYFVAELMTKPWCEIFKFETWLLVGLIGRTSLIKKITFNLCASWETFQLSTTPTAWIILFSFQAILSLFPSADYQISRFPGFVLKRPANSL